MKALNILLTTSLLSFGLISLNTLAATVDGVITTSEYQWNTTGVEGSSKWDSYRKHKSNEYQEYNDASGGDPWNINYLGTSISNGQFQFGAIGGKILSGKKTGSSYSSGKGIYLGDFAIGVNAGATDPKTDSSAFQYAIRLLDVNNNTGIANFELLEGGIWEEANIYAGTRYENKHKSATYKMVGATSTKTFSGLWTHNGHDNNVLEGGFDISWLSIFDPSVGGTLSTYLTMACVNDEALVHADVSAVPLPAAFWLFTPVFVGLIGFRRRLKA